MKLPVNHERLSRSFYDRPTDLVARELLGKALLRRHDGQWLGGWIVETEAYLPDGDLASHSARGKTPGNAAMFGPPGTLYVYPIHAKYCMNTVTESVGFGSAVLIRAIEPVWGIERMQENRGTDDLRRLSRGPAMLCQALGIDRSFDTVDLLASKQIIIADRQLDESSRVTATTRIGISKSQDRMLRYFVDGSWFVSGRASDHYTRPSKKKLGNTT
jgi:DNA-3-methyladenine glycosylase